MKYLTIATATLAATAAMTTLAATAAGAQTPRLTVYTYDSFVSEWGPGPAIEAAFEEVCACDLNLVGLGDGAALLARLKLEGARSDADVVLGLDTSLIAAAKETGLFKETPVSAQYSLPIAWTDPVFAAYDWGYFAFVHDKDLTPPANFRALGRERCQHRHPGSAVLHAGARPADVGQGRLRR